MDISGIRIENSEGYERYKRLCRKFNSTQQEGCDPLTGLRHVRFINKNIDKTSSNWINSNMIEVNDLWLIYFTDTAFYTVGLTDYEVDKFILPNVPIDEGFERKDFRKIDSPFVSSTNIIEEIFSPFLICKGDGVIYDVESMYDSFGELLDLFEYDYENNAYIVNDINDIINTKNTEHSSSYNKLSPRSKKLFDSFFWDINYHYVPIKTDAPVEEQTSSVWR